MSEVRCYILNLVSKKYSGMHYKTFSGKFCQLCHRDFVLFLINSIFYIKLCNYDGNLKDRRVKYNHFRRKYAAMFFCYFKI